jgi:hypothetical protein
LLRLNVEARSTAEVDDVVALIAAQIASGGEAVT